MALSSEDLPVAGYLYAITCTVSLTEGVSGSLQVQWLDSAGQQLMTSDDIIVGPPVVVGLTTNLTLRFNPIRLTDDGLYTCMALFTSPANTIPVNVSASHYIDVLEGNL